ncbi:MAG: hypothetical protein DRQ51_10355 [Gammaproteobacteria bacterium]|nr:MAG: hypothetical protein DRQ51_10355 [Gammaproteobacteria bacterium]
MNTITIEKSQLKDIVREAVSEAFFLDISEVDDNSLSQETLDICQKADEQEFNDGSASSFNEVYKRCMK